MKNRLCSFLLVGLLVLATALPVFSQTRTPIVVAKNPVASAAMTADGNLWTAAQPALNFTTALVSVRKSGTVSGCTLTFYTGQTAATATAAVNDANAAFSCATATNKVITNIDNYLQGTISSWTGTGTITIYVTLTNGAGWSLNATLSSVTQGDGAASPGAVPWYVRGTDGTNLTPAGDAQARAFNVKPGNGTNAEKHVLDGVGALGAGVLQTATIGTKSAAITGTMAQAVAVTTGGGRTVILGVIIEKATNTSGVVTITSGTGTACASNAVVELTLGPGTGSSPLPVGYYPVNALNTADREVCITTDGAGTVARVVTQ